MAAHDTGGVSATADRGVTVERRRIGAVVRGVVQGVGFRRFVERSASGLRLDGWVMNRADGCVELDAEGSPDAIDALIAALHDGPPAASVEEVRITELPPGGPSGGFAVRAGAHRGD